MFELVVTLAIVAIAGAILVPTLRSLMGDNPVKAAADQVKSRWAEARAKAMEEGKPYRFSVTGDNTFKTAPDDDFDGPGGLKDELPRNVSFAQGGGNINQNNGGADGSTSVVFLPDGTATTDFELGLNAQGCAPVTLKMNKTTCSANVSQSKDR
jgi:Tfp pilus assembly protein FimT